MARAEERIKLAGLSWEVMQEHLKSRHREVSNPGMLSRNTEAEEKAASDKKR